MRTAIVVVLGLVGMLTFEGCGSDSTSASSNPFNKADASGFGAGFNGSSGGASNYNTGGDNTGFSTGGDSTGFSTGGDTSGASGGATGVAGGTATNCDPNFCPSVGTGTGCCVGNTCGADFGMGCVAIVPDAGP